MAYGRNQQQRQPRQDKRPFVYHGELASEGRPVKLKVDAEPRWVEKLGRDLVDVTIGQEALTYWCDNEGCAAAFKGRRGQTVDMMFEGGGKGQEDTSVVTVVGEQLGQRQRADDREPPPQERTRRPTQAAAAGVDGVEAGITEGKRFVGRNETAVKIALRRLVAVGEEWSLFVGALPDGHPCRGYPFSSLAPVVLGSLLHGTWTVSANLPAGFDMATMRPVTKAAKGKAKAKPQEPKLAVCPDCDKETFDEAVPECRNPECPSNQPGDDVPF